jgi:ABC-type antimicrobial peptide transport system ATPase subunit
MTELTTIKVASATRDALRLLADREGRTLDAQLVVLIARERRRLIGQQLSAADMDEDTHLVLNASAHDVANASR